MSGVTGNEKIQSREDYQTILEDYKETIYKFPGFISVVPSGSYNSDHSKTTFGDMDLITTIDGTLYDNDKKKIKSSLAKFLVKANEVVPFVSEKYCGKKYYNSGEIITVSYETHGLSACQIDNIIAMDETEAKFKKDFLDMPAAKQGIVLGLVKTALIEEDPNELFKRLNIFFNTKELTTLQEFEFNLSSVEIQLRKVTYEEEGSFKQAKREIVWRSRDFNDLSKILVKFDLSLGFDELLVQAKETLTQPRSSNRMAGVFKSMISIKSGEIGKQKGADKQLALDKVEELFGQPKGEVGILTGRFQPITSAHTDIINQVSKENKRGIVFLVKGKGTSKDKEINPFDEDIQKKLIEAVLPDNMSVQIINTGFFVDDINLLAENEFTLYAGTDRVKRYESFKSYIGEGKTLNIKEISRTDDDVSATKVRTALKEDDKATFEQMTDKRIHKFYNELKDLI